MSDFAGLKPRDYWGKNYRRFKQLPVPEPEPKPRRGQKHYIPVEWPRCQHEVSPPRDCPRCHPPLDELARLENFEGKGPPRPGPAWAPKIPAVASRSGQQTESAPKPTGCTCKPCPANKPGGKCRCGRFWWSKDRRPHCGTHDPNPAGDPTRPARIRWRD